jgi:glucose/mannose transport system substrate-binding protein
MSDGGRGLQVRLRSLIEAHRAPLARYLARLGVPPGDVDDAAQETFIVASAKLDEIPPGTERAFLFGTAARVASNTRRGVRRRGRTAASSCATPQGALSPGPSIEDLTDQLLGGSLLEDALEQMPPDVQSVFLLVELEDLPVASAARRLGLPEGTVASRLRRARERYDEWCVRTRGSFRLTARAARAGGPPAAGAGSPVDAEIVSWWVRPGETDALRALLGVYARSHPGRPGVASTAFEGTLRARAELSSRMLHGRPPDTFQVNGGRALLSWVKRTSAGEQMEPIDFLFSSEGWSRAFPRDVLDLVSHRGRLYAVPLNVHRTNSLFYNARVFAAHGLHPPATFDELYAAAKELRGRGVVPLALGYRDASLLTMLAFEVVLVGEAGSDYYRDFFAGRRSADDAEIRYALAHIARMLDHANEDAATTAWHGALDLVRTGRAGMAIMGDWAKGYFINEGCRPGEDFGQAQSPGARAFVFATDVFGLPRRATHPAEAIDLLRVFGSKDGQVAFNRFKGSIPARVDVDASAYDPAARSSMCDFMQGPRVPSMPSIVPATFGRALDAAMCTFARRRDPDVVVDAIRSNYCLLGR